MANCENMVKLTRKGEKIMRKTFYIFTALIVTISMSSCMGIGNPELSESEKKQVIERARKFIITVNHLGISVDDKVFVEANQPKFFVIYNGYKSGTAKMVWRINPSYSIRIIFKGDLMDKSIPPRMTISRFK